MIRVVIFNLFLVSLPFVLYWGYISLVARKRAEKGNNWNEAPLALLLVAGVVLALSSLVYLALTNGFDPDSIYRPAEYKDGELIPARTIPPSPPVEAPDG